MYFSVREKQLLELLLLNQHGVTLETLMRELGVSKRTIYREIATIEDTLVRYHLRLNKKLSSGFYLEGEIADIAHLKKELYQTVQIMNSRERQSYLTCLLLLTQNQEKLSGLAMDLNVSVGTITSDLTRIAQIISEFQMTLHRGKGKSVMITGDEESLRLLVSGLITSELNDYEFLEMLGHVDEENYNQQSKTMPFLNLLDEGMLVFATKVTLDSQQTFVGEITDTGLKQFIIILTLSLMRIKAGYSLQSMKTAAKELVPFSKAIGEFIAEQVNEQTNLELNQIEKEFLCRSINGARFFSKKSLFSDEYDFELVYQVKQLIRLVSDGVEWDFTKDYTLFNGLLTHIGSSLIRTLTPVHQSTDNLLASIRERYPRIYDSVMSSLWSVFPKNYFSENDRIYLVIHFASSLENNQVLHELKTLVICSSGIGTSKMLENRLYKNFPEMKEIDVIPLSQIQNQDLTKFDFIFSTIVLPGFTSQYQLITPLLLKEEVQVIRTLIEENNIRMKQHKKNVPLETAVGERKPVKALQDMYDLTSKALHLVEMMSIIPALEDTVEEVLVTICQRLEEAGILTNGTEIQQQLLKRMTLAPIGLPNTKMALFHTSSPFVMKSYFGIYQLQQPIEIMGIDHVPIKMERILLMLAPKPLPLIDQELLGLISSTLIEDEKNMKLFDEGIESAIREKLERIFSRYIQEKLR
ncbi:BglG family transcription antiterminator [Carnobacterium gallinarum]|uniref:BglG family transcription antiterminator n=1 Tax=Carnobacterium gallinarum TaxID=2749 RepID=UPI000556D6C1|nr:helix-turn-helix domain-containing protein [Carnobacterium gallinarum]